MNQAKFAIETVELKRTYRIGSLEVHALRGINMQIGVGQFIALKGRSGSGKTTLLNCIGGLDQPTAGSVRILGEEIAGWNEGKLTTWRRKNVGFIFQSLGLLPVLSAFENVELMLRLNGVTGRERFKRTEETLELVGLTKWSDHRPYELSGGQQQRVAIARALANDPDILVADEPTGSLDSVTADHIFDVFSRLVAERGKTIIMVTHDMGLKSRFTRCLTLVDGELQPETQADAKPKRSRKK